MKKFIGLLLALGLLLAPSADPVAGEMLPNGQQQFSDANGVPYASGFVYMYVPGTTTPKLTWQDPALTVPNSNPIRLDSAGRAIIWGNGSYRQVLDDSSGNLVWDVQTAAAGNVSGPTLTVVGHLVTWDSTNGTLLGGDPQIAVNENDLDLSPNGLTLLSSLNSLYFSSYSQLTAVRLKQALSGGVADTTGSFRDALYIEMTDSDTSTYTFPHITDGLRISVFGPYTNGGGWQIADKTFWGGSFYSAAATSSVGQPTLPPGVSAVAAESVQYGGGSAGNIFITRQPRASDGSVATATGLAGVQAVLDSNFGNSDATHAAYAVLASTIGTKAVTAVYGYSGAGINQNFIDAGNAYVTRAGILMPHSASNWEGTIINYSRYNGGVVGDSYTYWDSVTNGGQYVWVDAGIKIASTDVNGTRVGSGGALATTATGPFVQLSSMSGTPTGVPPDAGTGRAACTYDTAAHKMWCYDWVAAAWKFAQFN